jgi:hypothetical protein
MLLMIIMFAAVLCVHCWGSGQINQAFEAAVALVLISTIHPVQHQLSAPRCTITYHLSLVRSSLSLSRIAGLDGMNV